MSVNRLGDIIDDYCGRCRLLTNHSVVAIVGEEVKRVRCRTCDNEHDYRHGKGTQKKKAKLSPYEEVLASILAGKPSGATTTAPETIKPAKPPARRLARPLSSRHRPSPR
ncbi:MAG: hypothetical protein HY648_12275 [Acidobacteria bacterium]|nr:hypothetical protein [Acidobacteriota bacterium]